MGDARGLRYLLPPRDTQSPISHVSPHSHLTLLPPTDSPITPPTTYTKTTSRNDTPDKLSCHVAGCSEELCRTQMRRQPIPTGRSPVMSTITVTIANRTQIVQIVRARARRHTEVVATAGILEMILGH